MAARIAATRSSPGGVSMTKSGAVMQDQGRGDPADGAQQQQDDAGQRGGQHDAGAEDAEIGDDEQAEADQRHLARIELRQGRGIQAAQGQDERGDEACKNSEG